MNTSAVTALVIEPGVVLNSGTTNATEPSRMYSDVCSSTMRR